MSKSDEARIVQSFSNASLMLTAELIKVLIDRNVLDKNDANEIINSAIRGSEMDPAAEEANKILRFILDRLE